MATKPEEKKTEAQADGNVDPLAEIGNHLRDIANTLKELVQCMSGKK